MKGSRGRKLRSALLDLAFPPGCVSCGRLVEHSGFRHLCAACVGKLDYVEEPACFTCGHPFYGEVGGERICPHCEGLQPAYREGRTAVLCKGPARALVHELKYHRGLFVLTDLAEVFRRSPRVLPWLAGATLVPVPLHPRKRRHRGYNQSELLADTLAAAANDAFAPPENFVRVMPLLRRVADTRTQTAFDRKERRANLKNAFALTPGAAITPAHRYVLVDDVFTTGSTLNSCAGVLRRAGCLNLDVVTFGHG